MIYAMVKDIAILVILCTFSKNVGFIHCTKTRHVYYAVYGFDFVIDEYIRHAICEYED